MKKYQVEIMVNGWWHQVNEAYDNIKAAKVMMEFLIRDDRKDIRIVEIVTEYHIVDYYKG